MPSFNNNQERKIDKLIKTLGVDLGFTGREIAEILWLSLKRRELMLAQDKSKPQTKIDDKENKNQTANPNLSSEPPQEIKSIPVSETPKETTPIYPDIRDNTKEKKSAKNNLPLRIPDAPSIPLPLEFAKALQPLMQQVSSQRNTVLDEIETANQIAKTGIFVPVFKPEPEPWLDLVLVVDKYKSMTLWQHTLKDLKQLFRNYGIFREVKMCGLSSQKSAVSKEQNHTQKSEEKPSKIILTVGGGEHKKVAKPQQLIDTTGRRLILIVSDCIAPCWHDGSMLPILEQWVKYQPLAILQMLPDWMWRKTGLRIGSSVKLQNLVPGNSNKNLIIKELLLWRNLPLEEGIKVPVLTLEPELAKAWSQMLVGKPEALASGFVLPNEFEVKSENLPENKVEKLNPEKRVYRFRMNASPTARKLASLLSAAPMICLPVVRIIQGSFLPQVLPVHIAEVFLGGLLKPTKEITQETNSESVEYKFVDEEVRKILLKGAPVSDSQKVFDAVSKYVKKHFGKSMKDFVVLLKSPTNSQETVPAFAEIGLDILKELGGDYRAFVENLEKEEGFFPSELEVFKYEYKTPKVNQEGKIIKEDTNSARYFKESLGEKVELEMVAIPGGTFTMGSPESEEGRFDNEGPQHDVNVPPFFMGKYPVTQGQWRAIASRTDLKVKLDLKLDPSRFKKPYKGIDRWNRPVEKVTWFEAVEFCERVSKLTGRKYRLPSEAEWEYACRAGTTTPFYFGETITPELVNYNGNYTYGDGPKGEYRRQTTPVGQFPANAFGLYDMHGNLWEWCADDSHDNYVGAPTDGSAWVDSKKDNSTKSNTRLRGGSWDDYPDNCRSAIRGDSYRRDDHYYVTCFRLVCDGGRAL